jgi:hypothetical protein
VSALLSRLIFAIWMATGPVSWTVHAPSRLRREVVDLDEEFPRSRPVAREAAERCAEAPPRGLSSRKAPWRKVVTASLNVLDPPMESTSP